MYEYIEGEVAARTAARLVLDVGGIGYDLAVPVGTAFPGSEPGSRLRVWTHLVVREDAHLLFGFPDSATRELFRALLGVNRVGPQVALGIVSGLPRAELVEAIVGADVARLTAIRGVGKKMAEQIVLDLRDKATRLLPQGQSGDDRDLVPRPPAPSEEALDDAIGALVSIGYSEKEARKHVERASQKVDVSDLELLVRTAIQGRA